MRHDSELAHHTLNCLVQLSSLNGSAMTKKENRVGYLVNYLSHFLRLMDNLRALGSIRPMEALGCSNIGPLHFSFRLGILGAIRFF